ncbi:MAG: hypothetical protein FJW26_02075 [Acidimicrobiia bacterium]|nr:hypothetical protein [Acidimicrobiia bacterium]
MLRRSFTAVLEKNAAFSEDFETEPYEVGWATEARFFVRVLNLSGDQTLFAGKVQISPDGISWCDEGTVMPQISQPGLYSCRVREFGNWLRLQCELSGAQPAVKVLIYLALKE